MTSSLPKGVRTFIRREKQRIRKSISGLAEQKSEILKLYEKLKVGNPQK